MKTCRECEAFDMLPEIVNGICTYTNKQMHIDDECEYEICEEDMQRHKEVDEYLKKETK